MTSVSLRDVAASDLPIFFEQQSDPIAVHMAAFTAADPADRAAFDTHMARVLANETGIIKTIVAGWRVAGSVLSYEESGHMEVSYWLGREFWGKGIATRALSEFLRYETKRPLNARAAKDNIASLRVLQKCGFAIVGEGKGFANARGAEIEEYILELSDVIAAPSL